MVTVWGIMQLNAFSCIQKKDTCVYQNTQSAPSFKGISVWISTTMVAVLNGQQYTIFSVQPINWHEPVPLAISQPTRTNSGDCQAQLVTLTTPIMPLGTGRPQWCTKAMRTKLWKIKPGPALLTLLFHAR